MIHKMPHVSRYKLPKKAEEKLIETLQLVFTKILRREEMDTFFNALLTKTEKLMLAKRLAIVVLLEEGLPESQIADSLHVTRMTVSRMQYYLESRGQGYKVALRKLAQEKQLEEFKKVLLSLLRYSLRAAGGRL